MEVYAAAALSPVRQGVQQFREPAAAHRQHAHATPVRAVSAVPADVQEQGVPAQTPRADASRTAAQTTLQHAQLLISSSRGH